MEKTLSFKEAYQRLEQIYNLLKNNEIIDIDEIINLQKEAEKLYNYCNDILKKVNQNDQNSEQ